MGTNDLSRVPVKDLDKLLQPEALFERFAARKAHALGVNNEFLEIKGTKGQVERDDIKAGTQNESIAFKCLHYSVTEASKQVDVTVVKRCTG